MDNVSDWLFFVGMCLCLLGLLLIFLGFLTILLSID